MEQISLHVYQSINDCPAPLDKHFGTAVDASSCVLIDGETYLRIYMKHLDWPITAKETLVVANSDIDLTENEQVRFIQGNAVAELRQMKEDGGDMVVTYGREIRALLLDNGLADEVTVIAVPVLIGSGEKVLECGLNDGGAWVVWSNKVLVDGKMRTMYGEVQYGKQILQQKCSNQLPHFYYKRHTLSMLNRRRTRQVYYFLSRILKKIGKDIGRMESPKI